MLTELLVYLRIEPPKDDWDAEPMAGLLPQRHSVYGEEFAQRDPRPTGGKTIWEWLVAEVDGRVGPPPAEVDPSVALLTPIEEVAPGVESVWLGVGENGAHTAMFRDDEEGWAFLGEPGWVLASRSADGLMTFVSSADDAALEVEPWTALRGREDVDYEPYEDNIVDLDELGRSLNEELDRDGAAALLDARPLMHELATWLELDEVVAAFDEDRPLGRFFVRDLLDLVGGSAGASSRLREVDFEPIEAAWQSCMSEIASRVHWVD
jgi:hypothetical protein